MASYTDTLDSVVEQMAKTNVVDGNKSSSEDNELSFAGRGLKLDSENDAEEVIKAIRECPKLTTLRLEGNTLGVDAAKGIAKVLECHPELKRAQWKDMFTGRLKSEIPKALMYLSGGLILAKARLVELDLSDNAFGPVGVEGIAELLKSDVCFSLKELRLNNNGLGINGGKLLAKSLIDCHINSSLVGTPLHLSVFVCGRNRLENEGATAIAEFFKIVGTLEEVQMPQNGIFHEGITALADGLQYNPNLAHLNFNDNILTEIGAVAIAASLSKLQNLEIINLGDCLVKDKGAQALAKAFEVGQSKLKEIVLGFNEIRAEAAIELVESLEMKQDLRKLDLNGNEIGEDGCSLIKGMMETIGKLDAIGSFSDDEGEDADEDDDDYEDVEDEDEEVEADEEEVVVDENQPPKQSSPIKIPEKIAPIQCSPEEYLASPSAAKLLGLGKNRSTLLLAEISKDSNLSEEKWVETFVKISSIWKPEINDIVIGAAKECTDSILAEAFKTSEKKGTLSILSNAFLVYLGLIKSEDKKFHPPNDLRGCLCMLDHAARQPYFARDTKEILQLFLSSKFHKAIEQTGPIKHQLMQTLYKY